MARVMCSMRLSMEVTHQTSLQTVPDVAGGVIHQRHVSTQSVSKDGSGRLAISQRPQRAADTSQDTPSQTQEHILITYGLLRPLFLTLEEQANDLRFA